MKRVVVGGAGYAGTGLAKALDKVAEVHLVDQRDRFVHSAMAIRRIVEPRLLEDVLVPYDGLLRRSWGHSCGQARDLLAQGTRTLHPPPPRGIRLHPEVMNESRRI